MRADKGEYPLEDIGWKNRDELTRSHTWGKELPADTNRAAQFRRTSKLQLLLVLPPEKEPHGDDGLTVSKQSSAKTKRNQAEAVKVICGNKNKKKQKTTLETSETRSEGPEKKEDDENISNVS
jgi:hypothetical protein